MNPSTSSNMIRSIWLILICSKYGTTLSCSKSFGLDPDKDDQNCQKYHICAFGYIIGANTCPSNAIFDPSLLKCVSGENCNQLTSHLKTTPRAITYQANFGKLKACPHSNFIVCSYPGWPVNDFSPNKVDFSMCTHVIYSFATVSGDFLISNASLNFPNVPGQEEIRTKYPDLVFLISVGGWTESQDNQDRFRSLFASEEKTQTFAISVANYLEKYSFDGLDMAFLHPNANDKDNYAQFMGILHKTLCKRNFILTASISGIISQLGTQFDFKALHTNVDHYHVMAYEYHGFWDENADHHSPLYKRSWDESGLDVESTIDFLQESGVPPEKIVLQIPAFGRGFVVEGLKREPPIP
ncbi:probable chitinase 10, partial [Tigriopus californicus]|uniref:probable chitinase 10 n=1 Tax=Tigriopus californicus TaxID=6832 RepID=UPI0027D9F549